MKQVLWSCLEWNPEDRPSAAKIFEARGECDSDGAVGNEQFFW